MKGLAPAEGRGFNPAENADFFHFLVSRLRFGLCLSVLLPAKP